LIGIFRDDPEGLYLLAQRGMPTEMGRYKIDPWPVTKGILGRVARTGELAWVNDLAETPEYSPKNHLTRSLLVIPILREDRVLGVIDLESTEHDYFTSDDVGFVRIMVSHAAIAIENAQLFEQVRAANKAKTEFMSIAAHELKIPMTSIKGYGKLMQMGAAGALSEKQGEFLNVIGNNVDRMARLVQDLLDVSRIEEGRIRLEIQDVKIQEIVEEVLETVKTQIENKHLKLTV
jgi:signal transduction histidine kinase